MDAEALRAMLERGMTLEQIGDALDRHPSTVSYWLTKHGLQAANADRHRPRGAIDRSVLAELTERGLSITELAGELGRSKATVRHWLRRYELKTLQATRRAQRRAVTESALVSGENPPEHLNMRCRHHGDTVFVREGSGYYRCARCRAESVADHRRRLKDVLVAEAGGRCAVCGYDRGRRALQFHHLDRATKEFAISRRGVTRSIGALRAEVSKCVLLCANCHAEVEDGAVTLPVQ